MAWPALHSGSIVDFTFGINLGALTPDQSLADRSFIQDATLTRILRPIPASEAQIQLPTSPSLPWSAGVDTIRP